MAHRIALSAALALGLGCASTRHQTLTPPARESRAAARSERRVGPAFVSSPLLSPEVKRAIETAAALVGRRTVVVDGVNYGPGCAALVRAALVRAGRPLPPQANDAASIEELARSQGAIKSGLRPAPGDLLFLADRPGGPPAHVGIVARLDPDGTVVVFHRVARGIMRVRVNLGYPDQTNDPVTGRRVNDLLTVGAGAVPAGSLVTGFAAMM